MVEASAKRPSMRLAQTKADRYRSSGTGRPQLADFAATSAKIASEYEAAERAGSTVPYFDRQAVLRRWVYRYGQAYADADMATELKWYVEERTDPARGLKADNTFVWLIRLVTLVERETALALVSQSTWSKMAPVLALAHRLDVHYRYLEPFIYMGGRMDGILQNLKPDHPPEWVSGLTRTAQDTKRAC